MCGVSTYNILNEKKNVQSGPGLYSETKSRKRTGEKKCARIKTVGPRRNDGQTERGHTEMYGHRRKSIYRDFASHFTCLLGMSLVVNLSLA